jgi:sulfur transfer protein SufE/stress-induced morphogen
VSIAFLAEYSSYSPTRCASLCRPRSFARPVNIKRFQSTDPQALSSSEYKITDNALGLTVELQKLTDAFHSIGDDKLRYKQLLFMANQLKPMDKSSQIPENKVRGCLSTVYIDGTTEVKDGKVLINFVGDSDGLLTKGLVALLVRGLSGNTAADIQNVDPRFIQQAGIEASLTPGRNNGFLNMLATMKMKALELENQSSNLLQSIDSTGKSVDTERPLYNHMMSSLQALKPTTLQLTDVSYQHAGHREAGDSKESHFELFIVSDAFEDLNLVKRHKLIYLILGDVMSKIHALQIQAKTPAEASSS